MQGYCLAGFSFTPEELVASLRARLTLAPDARQPKKARQPKEGVSEGPSGGAGWGAGFGDTDGPAGRFAELWPDSISGLAAARDLGWVPLVAMEAAVDRILAAHAARDQL